MQRLLMGVSALALTVAAASVAQASDPLKLKLGGYMEYWVAGASQGDDYASPVNSFDIQGDSQIYFQGKTTLDSGVEVGARVQISSGSDYNDPFVQRSWLWTSGNFGKVIAGKYRDVVWLTHNYVPEASHLDDGINGSDTYQILPFGTVRPLDPNEKPTNYANKILYLTPKFYGFQWAGSFTPSNNRMGDDSSATSETIVKDAGFDQAWATALSYGGTFGEVGFNASVGYNFMNGNRDAGTPGNVHNLQVSSVASYQGFSVGAAFNRMAATADSFYAERGGHSWKAGVGYTEGPYQVSFSYNNSTTRGRDLSTGKANLDGTKDYVDFYRMGARYTLGPGVDLWGALLYLESESHTGKKADGNEGAIAGVVGLRLDF